MTSLQHQLKKLKKPASQALAVERDYSSLLFDKKEAAEYDRDAFYKIGLAGLAGMKALDDDFDTYEPELFEKRQLRVNRAMLGQEEADALNALLERSLLRLSPYFHHQCCRQVLEWLIHQFQVHTYNAETVFLAFLPYHSLNSFGRLLHILKFNTPDWEWLAEYQKDAAPVPLNILCRVCTSGRSYWLISALSAFVQKIRAALDADYIEQHVHHYFTFLVSLYGKLVEAQMGEPDEQLVSRLVPFIGIALKSKLTCFKCAGIMLVCVLAMHVPLSEEVALNFVRLLFHKPGVDLLEIILPTVAIICERLRPTELPKKSILRLIYASDELQLSEQVKKLMASYNLNPFLAHFWQTLVDELKTREKAEWCEHFTELLMETMDFELMDEEEAELALGMFVDWVEKKSAANTNDNNGGEEEVNGEEEGGGKGNVAARRILPKKLRKFVRSMVIRFAPAFDAIRASKRPATVVERFMRECHIASHEVGQLEMPSSSSTNAAAIVEADEMRNGKLLKKNKKKKRKRSLMQDEQEEEEVQGNDVEMEEEKGRKVEKKEVKKIKEELFDQQYETSTSNSLHDQQKKKSKKQRRKMLLNGQ